MEYIKKLQDFRRSTDIIFYKGEHRLTNKLLFLKEFKESALNQGIPATAIREISMLKELQHPNIVHLENVFVKPTLVLSFEFVPMDLKTYIIRLPRDFEFPQAAIPSYLHQIVSAIAYCHKHRIFHRNLDVIFKKRFCLKIVNSAVEIMHKDLHEMNVVDETKSSGSFPRCMVSRNTFELINLMEKVLKEAEDLSGKRVEEYVLNDIQERLQATVPIILERYADETINAHGKFLQNIPQQTALFHNNCTYLAWWFNNFGKEMGKEIFQTERRDSIVSGLQEQGSKQFDLQIANQRAQLMEILKEFDLNDSMVELGPNAHKIVRQCMRQLDLLKNVWQTILPEIVYNKSLGTILNDLCDEIIRKVMSREDISSAVANGMDSICEVIIERAPSLFADPFEISIHVKHWVKLQKIKMILSASMAHIAEQWADGNGPLTLNFRAEDIRHLIRALFQNTDRRANVLATSS